MGMGISEAITLMENAQLPWAQCKCPTATYYGIDGKSEIRMCLHCTKAECDDCLSQTSEDKKTKKETLFDELFRKGLKEKEVCEIMQISRRTYYYYSKKRKDKENESK